METAQNLTPATNSAPPNVAAIPAVEKNEEKSVILTDEEYGILQKYQAERNTVLLNLGAIEERKQGLFQTLTDMQNEREKYVHVLEAKYHLPSGVRWGVEQASKKITFIKADDAEIK